MSERRRVILKGFTSSNVAAVTYFPDESELRVVYQSDESYVYVYAPVSSKDFVRIMEAESVGSAIVKVKRETTSKKIKRKSFKE